MAGPYDILQSASNSVAQGVSVPVDAIAWLLRRVGVPVPQAPVGGSDWMQNVGLTKPVEQSGYSVAGETLGNVLPMTMAAKAPQIARGLLSFDDYAMNKGRQAIEKHMANTGLLQPITVWHGSPHKFDKFDAKYMGTGEGAQAYGPGTYLAEAKDTGKSYVPRSYKQEEKMMGQYKLAESRQDIPAMTVWESALLHQTPSEILSTYTAKNGYDAAHVAAAKRAAAWMNKNPPDSGFLYKADLPDEWLPKMLDWDKPLKDQPEILKTLGEKWNQTKLGDEFGVYNSHVPLLPLSGGNRYGPTPMNATGADLIRRLKQSDYFKGDEAAVSAHLKELGIPGIRYLDGMSRGAGQGSHNYVVFPGNEGLLNILERY